MSTRHGLGSLLLVCASFFAAAAMTSLSAAAYLHAPHLPTAAASACACRVLPCTQEDQFCDEFHLVDLRLFDNCKKVCEGCDHVFNLAADMGGMGFIQSNHSVILYNNTMISYNMMEAARQNGVTR